MKSKSCCVYMLCLVLIAGNIFNQVIADETIYEIDPAHSFVEFRVSHLGISFIAGRFNEIEGVFHWDQSKPETAKTDVTVKTGSIDTNWAERDKHLRGDKFLDVKRYPDATFKSTGYEGSAETGQLHGVYHYTESTIQSH